jgi:hypothetical protein
MAKQQGPVSDEDNAQFRIVEDPVWTEEEARAVLSGLPLPAVIRPEDFVE